MLKFLLFNNIRKFNEYVFNREKEILLIIVLKFCLYMIFLFEFLVSFNVSVNVKDIFENIVFDYLIEVFNEFEFRKCKVFISCFLLKNLKVYDEDK